MAPTKDQILERLAAIAAPDGRKVTESGALSDIVVSDGKVFFSISVDAGAVKAWEPVRKQVEEAVKSVPGVDLGDDRAHRRTCGRRGTGAAGRQRRQQGLPKGTDTRMASSSRGRPAFPASNRSSRSLPERAASANPRPRSISRSACAISA